METVSQNLQMEDEVRGRKGSEGEGEAVDGGRRILKQRMIKKAEEEEVANNKQEKYES